MLCSSSNLVPYSASFSGPRRWKSDGTRSGLQGAQFNQLWRLPPGFIDLCKGRHCHAESTRLLDSCWPHSLVTLFQFMESVDVRIQIDGLTSGHHIHQNHSISDHDPCGGRGCLELLFSWWLRMMPLHWLPVHLWYIMVSPGFITCDDPGQKGLRLSIEMLQ
jgi:hypothetical protein